MSRPKLQIERYLQSPADHFSSPQDVVDNSDLDRQSKVKILNAWRQEELQLMKASEENMTGPKSDQLAKVELALISLSEQVA